MRFITDSFGLSLRRACDLVSLARSTFHYPDKPRDPEEDKIRERLKELAQKKRRYGCPRLHILLRREGLQINHKRTERLYREEKLSLRRKRSRKKIAGLLRVDLPKPVCRNHVWGMDFVSDHIATTGRRFKVLAVVDEYTKECHRLEVDTSINGARVCRVLDEITEQTGLPEIIIIDNGPEFAGRALDEWAYNKGIKLFFIRPGKPVENAYIESFNGKFRDECLNEHWFVSLDQARQVIEDWRVDYNNNRPHSSLGYLTPVEFIRKEVNLATCVPSYSLS